MTTTPFLGCKISLISKSEIRYEGILYTIDPKESTIALAKVRSYGTEDRPTDRKVPPREEIFEYIIFRAGDIKDLIVDDPPASIAPGLADPAIIQAHSTSTSSAATFPSTTFPQMTTSGVNATSGQRPTGPAFNTGANAINSLTGNITAQSKTSASTESRSRNSTPTNVQHRSSPQNDWSRGESEQVVTTTKHTPNKENHQRRNTGERGFRRGMSAPTGGPQNFNQNYNQNHTGNKRGQGQANRQHDRPQGHYPQQTQPGHRFGGSAGFNRQQYNAYSNSNSARRPQSRPQQQQRGSHQNRFSNRPAKEPLKFDDEYDWVKANDEFKDMEEKMSNLKMEGQPEKEEKADEAEQPKVAEGSANGDKDSADGDSHFYDKSKSFFDTISCEAIEREKGNVQRLDWKAERKLNSETFGVALSHRRYGYGYGYGRGRGGYSNRGYSGFRHSRGGFSRGRGAGDGRRFNGPRMESDIRN